MLPVTFVDVDHLNNILNYLKIIILSFMSLHDTEDDKHKLTFTGSSKPQRLELYPVNHSGLLCDWLVFRLVGQQRGGWGGSWSARSGWHRAATLETAAL